MSESDKNSLFSPCHVSLRPNYCRCCSDHRRTIIQLQADLDAERAATADLIGIIRRLEREKSDAMMESSHFKKFTEEKMARYSVEIEALERENDEKEHKRRKKAEACLYTTIKDIYFDLVDHDKVRSFRIQKQWPFTAFKEIRFESYIMCEPINERLTFKNSELEDGDIICLQKAIPSESDTNYDYPDVPSFLEYIHYLRSKE